MKIILKSAITLLTFCAVSASVFADNAEEYKCDLMMRGYEFSNNGLSEAIIKKDKEAVELFLKADINLNLPDNEGLNALDRAIKIADKETVLLISMAGGQTNQSLQQSNKEADTDNNLAPKPEISIKKINSTENNTEENTEKITTNELCEAVNADNLDLVAKIAKNSTYLNTLTQEGLAPIHYAIFNNNPSMVHLLLNNGADVNILTDDGLTPLDIAVLNNQKIIAKELLENGGAMSVNVAQELIKFGCQASYDEEFGLYDAEFNDIFDTMEKIQNKIKQNNPQ